MATVFMLGSLHSSRLSHSPNVPEYISQYLQNICIHSFTMENETLKLNHHKMTSDPTQNPIKVFQCVMDWFVLPPHLPDRVLKILQLGRDASCLPTGFTPGFCPVHHLHKRDFYPFHLIQISRMSFARDCFYDKDTESFQEVAEKLLNLGTLAAKAVLKRCFLESDQLNFKEIMGSFCYETEEMDIGIPGPEPFIPFHQWTSIFSNEFPFAANGLLLEASDWTLNDYFVFELVILGMIQSVMESYVAETIHPISLNVFGELSSDKQFEKEKRLIWDYFERLCVSHIRL